MEIFNRPNSHKGLSFESYLLCETVNTRGRHIFTLVFVVFGPTQIIGLSMRKVVFSSLQQTREL